MTRRRTTSHRGTCLALGLGLACLGAPRLGLAAEEPPPAEPGPSEVEAAPAPDPELELLPSGRRPRKTPEDGKGRIVAGGVLIGSAVVFGAVVGPVSPIGGVAGVTVVSALTLGGLGGGAAALVYGIRRHRDYRAHLSKGYPAAAPHQGHGFLASGSFLLVAGSIGMTAFAIPGAAAPIDPVRGGILAGSGVSLVGGTALLVLGAHRNGDWKRSEASVRVQPTFNLSPQGGSVGVAGQF